jgi:membrane-associated protease RseP (regulator of RpoE activity)
MIIGAKLGLAILIAIIIHVFTMAFAGWFVGAQVQEVSLFFGPRLLRYNFRGTWFNIHYIPMGGSVKLDDNFQRIHPLKRIFTASAGCIGLFLLAAGVFGFSGAYTKIVSGFTQITNGALSPRSVAPDLLVALYSFLKANSVLACVGLVASKFAAANLLPIPMLNGGDIMLSIIGIIKPVPDKAREYILQLGLIILLALYFCWFVAIIYFVKMP